MYPIETIDAAERPRECLAEQQPAVQSRPSPRKTAYLYMITRGRLTCVKHNVDELRVHVVCLLLKLRWIIIPFLARCNIELSAL